MLFSKFSGFSIFWLCAALCLGIALLFVILPFLSKKSSLWAKITGIAMAVGLVCGSISLYQHYGALEGVEDKSIIKNIADALSDLQQTDNVSRDKVLTTLKALERQLPDRGAPWAYLAGVYQHLGFLEMAQEAYRQASHFDPKVLAYVTQEAIIISKMQGGKLPLDIKTNLKTILTTEPNNQDALNLLAIDAYQTKEYKMALKYWQEILTKIENLSEPEIKTIKLMMASATAQK